MSVNLSRRSALTLGAASLAAGFAPASAFAAPMAKLDLWGPPAGPSAVLAHAVASGFLDEFADASEFHAWRNPDELRAGLSSKNIGISVVPVQAAANLYNRGFPIKMVNVMTQGLLYIISADPNVTSTADLKGMKLVVPFKGDTPDIIFDHLMAAAGLTEGDIEIFNVGTPVEAVQMLMTGRANAALLPEPAVSAAIMKAKSMGKSLTRVIDVQEEWGKVDNTAPIIPQAGLAVTGPFLAEHGDLVAGINAALAKAAASTLTDPMKAAKDATGPLGMPAPVLAQSIKNSRLGVWTASEMRPSIERMLNTMAEVDPKKIGGKLPDDAFYLL
ncbi:MAG: taurine ABC transporter substrate-binding protein [Rhodobacterales bacterium]|nr:MAG: taurine ABC transporter substrate-binding protein [Rhodobacterales bacterium]